MCSLGIENQILIQALLEAASLPDQQDTTTDLFVKHTNQYYEDTLFLHFLKTNFNQADACFT